MRILIIGSGGREHALAWAVARSQQHPEVFIAPGNAGTAEVGTNVPIAATDVEALRDFALEHEIDLTVVGPEQPLVLGLVDQFEEDGLTVIGPTAAAAQLEGSKVFAKDFMQRHGIPTAAHRSFKASQYDEANDYLERQGVPVVVKASGLAAGKGALICKTQVEARAALDSMLRQDAFGEAGREVVIEEYMDGEEASVFALCDGEAYVLLAPAQDHKRIGDGDTGPNTGGMGAYAPASTVTAGLMEQLCQTIIDPTLRGMAQEGTPYRGFLYVGLMTTREGPKVVEYNCRLGDPEAQVVLPLLKSDLVTVFEQLARRNLRDVEVQLHPGAAACVVMASRGYPGDYAKGFLVEGLEEAASHEDVMIFHAGTQRDDAGRIATAGGRVLGVTALGADLAAALDKVYEAVRDISFEGAQYRHDIGRKGLAHLGGA